MSADQAFSDGNHEAPIGYVELVRKNADFRNLWLGQVVSELGDWFSAVALLNVMLSVTGRAQVVAWFFIIVHIPSVLMGPFGGVLVDRLNRKAVMIATDVMRALLVLGYIWVQRADQIWMIYLIASLETALSTLFEPARNASIPNLCRPRELVAANAIAGITWSAMLTIGAAIGGFIAAGMGRNVCYVLDSLSFLISALLIARVRLPDHRAATKSAAVADARASGWRDISEGVRFIREHKPVLALLMVKAGWGLGGGILLLISVVGERIFPTGGSGAAGIGVLFAARGLGAGLGPVLARRIAGEKNRSMRRAIAAGFFLGSLFYVLFGRAGILPLAAGCLFFGHMGGSITWVFSTVLLQREIPDRFRGRIFAIELALLTLGIAISNYFAGYWLDVVQLSPRTLATILGLYFSIPGLIWLSLQRVFPK